MPLLLQRRLQGYNEIISVDDRTTHCAGVYNFRNFIEKECGRILCHNLVLELGQILKIPWEKVADLGNTNGFIDHLSAQNIKVYFNGAALTINQLAFLQRQEGKAGLKNNKPRYDSNEDFKDRCG